MLSGYIPASVTPFDGGAVDFTALEKYMNYLAGSGLRAVVVCGSTGEALALPMQEKVELIRAAAKFCSGKIKVIAGVIDSVTANCVELLKNVEDVVDGFLCICPFYVKPSQEQIFQHFKALSEATRRDIILYNNPARVGASIRFETYKRLAEISNIVGTKECSADLSVFSAWRLEIGGDFRFLSGNDDTACAALALGAAGVISVAANVAPRLFARLFEAFMDGDMSEFGRLRDELAPLHTLLFSEPSPAPVKYVLSKMGLMRNELREPLGVASEELCARADNYIERLGRLARLPV